MLLAALPRDPESPGDRDASGDDAQPSERPTSSSSYGYAAVPVPPAERMPPPPDDRHPEDRLPTYPRKQRPNSGGTDGPWLKAGLIGLLTVAALLLVLHAITRERAPEPGRDAVEVAVDVADDVVPALATTDPATVRRFVLDEYGWRIGVPRFAGLDLQGVGMVAIAPMTEVPAILYRDREGREAVALVLSYAFLDQVPDRLVLADADYAQLADARPSARRVEGRDVILLRDRADVFIVVTDAPPEAMLSRVEVER